MANRVGSSSRPAARASDVDFDAVPSPRPQKSFASSTRRSSIGISLQPSPPDAGGDVPFDEDNEDIFDDGANGEEPESPSPSKRRRDGPSNAVRDDENPSTPKARSKGKGKARIENHGGDEEEEAGQGQHDVEMQQEDEEPAPKKKPTGKRTKKRTVEFPCKKPFAMAQPSC